MRAPHYIVFSEITEYKNPNHSQSNLTRIRSTNEMMKVRSRTITERECSMYFYFALGVQFPENADVKKWPLRFLLTGKFPNVP